MGRGCYSWVVGEVKVGQGWLFVLASVPMIAKLSGSSKTTLLKKNTTPHFCTLAMVKLSDSKMIFKLEDSIMFFQLCPAPPNISHCE